MKQRIRDIGLLLKNDRKIQSILGGLLLLVVIYVVLSPSQKPRRQIAQSPQKTNSSAITASREAYDDIITRFSGDMKETQSSLQELKQASEENRKALQDYEARAAAIFTKMLERMNQGDQNQPVAGARQPSTAGSSALGSQIRQAASGKQIDSSRPDSGSSNARSPYYPPSLNGSAQLGADSYNPSDDQVGYEGVAMQGSNDSEELEPFGMDDSAPQPPTPDIRSKTAFIGVGDSVRLKLLSGVNAPTDGTPYPVVFGLVDNVTGPDGTQLPLGNARLVAAAQGSLSDSRALFRLTDLSIRLPDGQRRVYKVDGWVVGEDGIRGLKGNLIDPIGKAIGASFLTGALDGAAKGISQAQTSSVSNAAGGVSSFISGDVGQLAAGNALSGGIGNWSKIIQDRIEQLVPHVEVLSGREATAIFAKSVTVDDLYDALGDSEAIYASLD